MNYEIINDVGIIKDKFSDILEGLGASYTFDLDYECEESIFCGNPTESVWFRAEINGITYKEKSFLWHKTTQSQDSFLHEIKSYLLDVLDGVVNL